VKWRPVSGAPHAMSGLKTSPTLLGDFRTEQLRERGLRKAKVIELQKV
jgi:hypothetical protein